MRLALNPIVQLRAKAEDTINEHYNRLASVTSHRDHEHAAKRDAARRIADGGTPEKEFIAEAELMGVTPEDLARIVLAKTDDVMARGLSRRRAVLAVRTAEGADAIAAALHGNGISPAPPDALSRLGLRDAT